MPEADPIYLFIRPLNRLDIRYMVTGSLACIAYGTPRLTHDADVVIELTRNRIPSMGDAFREPEYYCPPDEILSLECAREQRGHFNIIHTASGLKADFYVAGRDPLHKWAMDRAQIVTISDIPVRMAPAEYVIIRKLEYYREGGSDKHLRDVAGIVAVSGDMIDDALLQKMISERFLDEAWKMVLSEERE